ncbi:SDR family oxidoreductase [Candidatus Acetothermia bacterium]|nr:SDR family oxidoreductase [Candidatus Acetothermia bacterium]MCI2427961.1 SDR family oxidoreductase [Candidatus Acetothermia bacterium]
MIEFQRNQWALILGGSSGFGLATAKKLSRHGMSVCIVHRDRRQVMADIERQFDEIRSCGNGFLALNLNALADDDRTTTLDALTKRMGEHGRVRLLLHSIALGYLKLIAPARPDLQLQETIDRLAAILKTDPDLLHTQIKESFNAGTLHVHGLIQPEYGADILNDEELARTIYAMGTNLLSWVRDLHHRNLFCEDARVLGLTSEGNRVSWLGYAAVAAAKVTLEAISRAIAREYAPYGIRANVIQAGVTDTPAMRAIPGSAQMKAVAQLRNPFGRLTRPEDVANFICLLCTDEAAWVNGAILTVDGGESIASL